MRNRELSDAIRSGNSSAVRAILAEDPLILTRTSLMGSIDNPLHVSALAGQTEITRELLRYNPALARELNQDGFSPMHIASANGYVEIVRGLLSVGNDLCLMKGKDGRTPLHCAAMKGKVDVVKELVAACPQSVKELTGFGETALHVAVKTNQEEVVKILIQEIKKLDMMEVIDWKDKDGNTMLHLATFRKQSETIGLLIGEDAIALGVEANATNASGFTPRDVLDLILQSGGQYGDICLLEMFQQAGAVKAKDMKRNPSPRQQETRNPVNHHSALSTAFSRNLWKGLMKEIDDSSRETQNALMVVAVLVATMTYQSVLSPPSGFQSEIPERSDTINSVQKRDTGPGEVIMAANHEVFAVFSVFNAIGFFASVAIISLLTRRFPLRAGLRLVILSMTATYIIAVIYTSPTGLRTINIVVLLVTLLVLAEFVRFTAWLLKIWGFLPTGMRRRSTVDGNQGQV